LTDEPNMCDMKRTQVHEEAALAAVTFRCSHSSW
jgi:hypothetical protein